MIMWWWFLSEGGDGRCIMWFHAHPQCLIQLLACSEAPRLQATKNELGIQCNHLRSCSPDLSTDLQPLHILRNPSVA